MRLSQQGCEYYQLQLTTTPVTLPTDWEASFDYGENWVPAEDVDGWSSWLLAGPKAENVPLETTIILYSVTPKVRIIDDPQQIVRDMENNRVYLAER